MDAMSPKRPRSVGDGVVRRPARPAPSEQTTNQQTSFEYVRPRTLPGNNRSRVSAVRRLLTIIISPIAVMLMIGFLYSRASLEIQPVQKQLLLYKVFDVTSALSNGTVHGIWLSAPVGSSRDLVPNSLYPDYIPLNTDPVQGSVLVLSRADILSLLGDDMARLNNGGQYDVQSVAIERALYDSGVFVGRPDRFQVEAEFTVVSHQKVDIERLREICAYKTLVPSVHDVHSCLSAYPGVDRARLVVHPWFALRIPIARALTVELVDKIH